MIAYNKTWLANLRLQAAFSKDLRQGRITAAELAAIKQKYPSGFYTPAIMPRIGLFILTCIIVLFGAGLLSLIFVSSSIITGPGWTITLGLVTYTALEIMVNAKHHYRSGVDDALLFFTALLLIGGAALIFNNDGENYLALAGVAFVLFIYLTLRFADMLMTALCCISVLAFIFFGLERTWAAGLSTMPFIMMIASGLLYWIAYKFQHSENLADYQNSFIIAQIVGLLAFYAAGNFFAIQTLSNEITGTEKPISFAPFFWAWTVLLPFTYLVWGIWRKDVIALRIGLLLIAAAAFTFRNYYHVFPVDVMLTVSGSLILTLVYVLMRYLKTPKHGFTVTEPDNAHMMDQLKIESLAIAATFSHSPTAPDKGRFGGGDFGGGGSSGKF
jgi:hypothetical protein